MQGYIIIFKFSARLTAGDETSCATDFLLGAQSQRKW